MLGPHLRILHPGDLELGSLYVIYILRERSEVNLLVPVTVSAVVSVAACSLPRLSGGNLVSLCLRGQQA